MSPCLGQAPCAKRCSFSVPDLSCGKRKVPSLFCWTGLDDMLKAESITQHGAPPNTHPEPGMASVSSQVLGACFTRARGWVWVPTNNQEVKSPSGPPREGLLPPGSGFPCRMQLFLKSSLPSLPSAQPHRLASGLKAPGMRGLFTYSVWAKHLTQGPWTGELDARRGPIGCREVLCTQTARLWPG